jgi:glycosyl transferase family 25
METEEPSTKPKDNDNNNNNNNKPFFPPFQEIEHCFYINLDKRTDRKKLVEAELRGLGLSRFKRCKAIENKIGAIGCSMSHLTLLRKAQKDNLPYCMIVEDDISFIDKPLFVQQANQFIKYFNEREKEKPLWDVLLIAGNNVPPYFRIQGADFCVRVTHCQTTTGYIVRQHYYSTLIENIKNGLELLMREPNKRFFYAIDKFWLSLQKLDWWFLITPLTVVQRDDFSDIEGKKEDYSQLMLDLDKKWAFRKN